MSNSLPNFINVPGNVLSLNGVLKNLKANQLQSNTTGQTVPLAYWNSPRETSQCTLSRRYALTRRNTQDGMCSKVMPDISTLKKKLT